MTRVTSYRILEKGITTFEYYLHPKIFSLSFTNMLSDIFSFFNNLNSFILIITNCLDKSRTINKYSWLEKKFEGMKRKLKNFSEISNKFIEDSEQKYFEILLMIYNFFR